MWSSDKTHVDTLHVHRNGADATALVRAMSRMLAGADLRPAGVPPSAILFVRRLQDPLPQRLSPGRQSMRTDPAWERAVQNALADSYHRAARPVRGIISSSANAVRFADEGEMLACLALDMQRGRAWQRWWWRVPLRDFAPRSDDSLAACLYRHVHFLPAVLQHLSAWGQATAVVEALAPVQVRQILAALIRAYELDDFTQVPPATGHDAAPPESAQLDPAAPHVPSKPRRNREPQTDGRHLRHEQPPWTPWVAPEQVPHTLTREQRSLLGLGLLLYQQSSRVSSREFQQAMRAWWAAPHAPLPPQDQPQTPDDDQTAPKLPQQHAPPTTRRPPHTVHQPVPADVQGTVEEEQPAPPNQRRTPPADRPAPDTQTMPTPADEPGTPSHRAEHETLDADDPPSVSSAHAASRHTTTRSPEDTAHTPAGTENTPRPVRNTDAPAPPTETETDAATSVPSDDPDAWPLDSGGALFAGEDGVETCLGGVLFLINMMLHLDLPDCFEAEWQLANQIGPWGTLEILGRALLPEDPSLANEPVWAALAHLDGRAPGTLPGTTFRGGDSLRLPVTWPLHLGQESTCHWAAGPERLCVWTDADYALVECACSESSPYEQAYAELRAYLAPDNAPALVQRPADQVPRYPLGGTLARELHPDLARWLAFVLPYLRFRLVQALQLDPAGTRDLLETLLLRRGQLYVTSTHVDLVMHLDDISLPVRMAGLDRNPGWLANFGRVILFHFE